jgi:hypothetical protein
LRQAATLQHLRSRAEEAERGAAERTAAYSGAMNRVLALQQDAQQAALRQVMQSVCVCVLAV